LGAWPVHRRLLPRCLGDVYQPTKARLHDPLTTPAAPTALGTVHPRLGPYRGGWLRHLVRRRPHGRSLVAHTGCRAWQCWRVSADRVRGRGPAEAAETQMTSPAPNLMRLNLDWQRAAANVQADGRRSRHPQSRAHTGPGACGERRHDRRRRPGVQPPSGLSAPRTMTGSTGYVRTCPWPVVAHRRRCTPPSAAWWEARVSPRSRCRSCTGSRVCAR
jgi:hypothetical protein